VQVRGQVNVLTVKCLPAVRSLACVDTDTWASAVSCGFSKLLLW